MTGRLAKAEEELKIIFETPHLLTFEAEESADVSKEYMLKVCCVAICHESAIVREGALYGLGRFLDDPEIVAMVTTIAENDVSDTIREIAYDILENE